MKKILFTTAIIMFGVNAMESSKAAAVSVESIVHSQEQQAFLAQLEADARAYQDALLLAQGHPAWSLGSLALAQRISEPFDTTRLLFNQSSHLNLMNRRRFEEFKSTLTEARAILLNNGEEASPYRVLDVPMFLMQEVKRIALGIMRDLESRDMMFEALLSSMRDADDRTS